MGFGDLNTESGLNALDSFLLTRSYVEGYVPSQADVAVLEAISIFPAAEKVNVCRWLGHMKSFSADQCKAFPGIKKPIDQYGAAGDVPSAADNDDDDLFGSDSDADEEAERIKQERLEAYQAKKSAKPGIIAKSNIILDIKPWDDTTDMDAVEKCVRSIKADGLLFGTSKLVPVAYGIKKLQISCVVEDDKIGTDFLEDSILAFEDFIQSMDVVAFNKI